MKEILTSENYKRIYEHIQVSDDFREKILSQKRAQARTTRHRYPYVAAVLALALILGGGTAYAYTHPALIRAFMDGETSQQLVEEMYAPAEQSIRCDGYIYTVEGSVYSEEMGVRYLSIRIQAEDGSVPTVKWGGVRTPSSALSLAVDGKQIILGTRPYALSACSMLDANEESAYVYVKYDKLGENIENSWTFYVASCEELAEKYPKEEFESIWNWDSGILEKICAEYEGIEISAQPAKEVKYTAEEYQIVVGYMDVYAVWNPHTVEIRDIAVIDENGNRQEIMINGEIVSNENKWAGTSVFREEDGTVTLCYPLPDAVSPDAVQVEVNGELLK